MRRLYVVLFSVVIFVLSSVAQPVSAQGGKTAAKCDPAALMAKTTALKATGDAKKDMAALRSLAAEIHTLNAVCDGFVFTGKGKKIVPPFTLPKGLWKVTGKTNDYLIVQARTLSGSECKPDVEDTLLNLDDAQAKEGGETVINIETDCRMLLSVSNVSTTWTITLEVVE